MKLGSNENAGKVLQRHEDEICKVKKDIDDLIKSNRLLSKAIKLCSIATLAIAITVLIKVVLEQI